MKRFLFFLLLIIYSCILDLENIDIDGHWKMSELYYKSGGSESSISAKENVVKQYFSNSVISIKINRSSMKFNFIAEEINVNDEGTIKEIDNQKIIVSFSPSAWFPNHFGIYTTNTILLSIKYTLSKEMDKEKLEIYEGKFTYTNSLGTKEKSITFLPMNISGYQGTKCLFIKQK